MTRALYRDSCYTIDDVNYTRERIMIIKGKRFIISSVFPVESTLTATDKMLELIDSVRYEIGQTSFTQRIQARKFAP